MLVYHFSVLFALLVSVSLADNDKRCWKDTEMAHCVNTALTVYDAASTPKSDTVRRTAKAAMTKCWNDCSCTIRRVQGVACHGNGFERTCLGASKIFDTLEASYGYYLTSNGTNPQNIYGWSADAQNKIATDFGEVMLNAKCTKDMDQSFAEFVCSDP